MGKDEGLDATEQDGEHRQSQRLGRWVDGRDALRDDGQDRTGVFRSWPKISHADEVGYECALHALALMVVPGKHLALLGLTGMTEASTL